jgi:glycosyltransferase involved in cell wall biosynthesis
MPAITTNTGGVAYVVRDGENGYILPFEARGEAYARVIAGLYQDEQRYLRLVQSSRAAFEERLNWDTWATTVNMLIVEMLRSKIR